MIDLVQILANLSKSLYAVQYLIAGLSYILGIAFIMNGFFKLKGIVQEGGLFHGKIGVPVANLMGGAALLYLPSMLDVLSNTAFGTSSLLQYTHYNPYNIYDSIRFLIQTAGLIWFVRGCSLLIHSSEGHEQAKGFARKGLAFIGASILAMNFEATIGGLQYVIDSVMAWFHS